MNLFSERPTQAKYFLLFPLVVGAAGGVGAHLISIANQFPAEAATSNGFGWGLVFGVNAMLVTIGAIGNERRAYWDYCKAQAQAFPVRTPTQMTNVLPILEQTTDSAYRPNMVYVPFDNYVVILHISGDQLKVLKIRVQSNQLGLPVNGLEKFSSSQAKVLRTDVLGLNMAQIVRGNQVEFTPEGAVAVLAGSPAPLMKARARR